MSDLQRRAIEPGIYRHYKGGLYYVSEISTDESTLEPRVEYRSLESGKLWSRLASSWLAPTGRNTPRYEPAADERGIKDKIAGVLAWGPCHMKEIEGRLASIGTVIASTFDVRDAVWEMHSEKLVDFTIGGPVRLRALLPKEKTT